MSSKLIQRDREQFINYVLLRELKKHYADLATKIAWDESGTTVSVSDLNLYECERNLFTNENIWRWNYYYFNNIELSLWIRRRGTNINLDARIKTGLAVKWSSLFNESDLIPKQIQDAFSEALVVRKARMKQNPEQ